MHRPAAGEAALPGAERGQVGLVGDHQGGPQRRQHAPALVLGEPRVERDREDAALEQREHRLEVGVRAGHEQGDPVALTQLTHVVTVEALTGAAR